MFLLLDVSLLQVLRGI